MGFDINQKQQKKLTGLLQILWIKYFRIDTGKKGERGSKRDKEFSPHLDHFRFYNPNVTSFCFFL